MMFLSSHCEKVVRQRSWGHQRGQLIYSIHELGWSRKWLGRRGRQLPLATFLKAEQTPFWEGSVLEPLHISHGDCVPCCRLQIVASKPLKRVPIIIILSESLECRREKQPTPGVDHLIMNGLCGCTGSPSMENESPETHHSTSHYGGTKGGTPPM